jgi:putative transposase
VHSSVGGEAADGNGDALRKRRHGSGRRSGQSWYTDGTYLKVQGRWCYLYRAIDRDGNLIDTMLSATRDMKAARKTRARNEQKT